MATLAFLQIDALVPLPGASDVKEGFTRVPLMLCPAFSAQVTEYHAAAPSNAAALSACASSFAAVDVRINSQPGSLLQLPLPAGSTADFPVAATLHARPDGATAATYTVHVGRNAPAVTGGDTVKIDTSAPVPAAAPAHAHSHGGVPCTHDHGHGTAAPAKKEEHSHGHGHGDHGHSHAAAAPKAAEAHGHSHAAPKAEAHGHAHDSATCTDASHDHGHGHGGHGHAHGGETKADAVPKAAAHGHSHDGKACNDASHGHAHAHGHGHGAEMDEGSDDDDSSLHAALHGQGGATGLLAPVPGVAGARWAQDADSVTVELMVPPGTRAADVAVVIGTARLDAGLKGVAGALAGVLGGRVSRDESSWSLCDDAGTRMLVISLAKDGSDAKKWSKLLA